MSEIIRLNMVSEYWKHSDAGLRDELDRMAQGFAFYTGNQWSAADIAKLDSEKRPHLTINMILPIINLLSGIQRQGRQDITVVARKGGLKKLAAVFTEIMRHCLDVTDADFEIADCFLDGVIGNKGWLGLGVNYDNDPIYGDIEVSKVSPFDMREDPDAKEYDLNRTGKFVIRDTWMDRDSIMLNYPAKRQDIIDGGLDIDPASGDIVGDSEKDIYRWRLRECWWKQHEKRTILINAASGEIKTVGADNQDLALAINEKSKVWFMKDWVVPVLHKTVTAGNIVLEDVTDPYNGVTNFPYYRFCPFWVDGYVMGVSQNLIGPQQEVNKRRSQVLHNLNQTANSGFIVKKVLGNYDIHLGKFGSAPGVVLDKSKAGGEIERIEPAPLSEGHITAARMSGDDMKEISGANPDLMGQAIRNENESGRAIELRQQQGMKVVEVMFDNFSRTQKLITLGLVDMVRHTDVYSDEEIRNIVSEKNMDADLSLLKSRKVGKYGIKIESSSSSPIARFANFNNLMEIVKTFPNQIPPDVVIENSDLANKENIIDRIVPLPVAEKDPDTKTIKKTDGSSPTAGNGQVKDT